jgi:hypothetical protein
LITPAIIARISISATIGGVGFGTPNSTKVRAVRLIRSTMSSIEAHSSWMSSRSIGVTNTRASCSSVS